MPDRPPAPTTETASDCVCCGDWPDGDPHASWCPLYGKTDDAGFALWHLVDGDGDYPWMLMDKSTLVPTWFEDEAEARRALAAARGDTP